MQTVSATPTPALVFTAVHPGIYAVHAEWQSGASSFFQATGYPSNVLAVSGSSPKDSRLLYMYSGDQLSVFSGPSGGDSKLALVRLGDEL
jgi:hypothetical protein